LTDYDEAHQRQSCCVGKVISVGPGKDGNLMTVKKGDVVLYGKYAGQEISYEGKDYLIMREDDILVILAGKKK